MSLSVTERTTDPGELYAVQAAEYLQTCSFEQALDVYHDMIEDPHLEDTVRSYVGLHDRYFFAWYILNLRLSVPQIEHPWLYERAREVEQNPDGYLDLWAREHFKSTFITFAGSLQELAKDRELTIGIFSHNAKHSRGNFVVRIKIECEINLNLPRYYPHVFWQNPKKQAPIWSRNEGLTMIRAGNPAEPSISGHGLVDGQPTGSHFGLIIYDDVVTEKSVTTPEMIIKTTDMYELSQFLGKERQGEVDQRKWHIGTRYNYNDTYAPILERKIAKPRIYPATDDGTPDGTPVYLSQEQWDKKKTEKSNYAIACQMLQNPLAGSEQEFRPEFFRRYELRPKTLNVYLTVDPASSKKKSSSNTGMMVVGVDVSLNKYLLDGALHKMNLDERWTMLKRLRNKWIRQPGIQALQVGYETYGHHSDKEHFEKMMKLEKKSFHIEPLTWPRDQNETGKQDRIRRLLPDHQNWMFFYPYDNTDGYTHDQRVAIDNKQQYLIAHPIKQIDEDGRLYDVTERLINNEALFFPAVIKLDGLDALSRHYDLSPQPPRIYAEKDLYPEQGEP